MEHETAPLLAFVDRSTAEIESIICTTTSKAYCCYNNNAFCDYSSVNDNSFCDLQATSDLPCHLYASAQAQIDSCIGVRIYEEDEEYKLQNELRLIELTELTENIFMNIEARLAASYYNNLLLKKSAYHNQQFPILMPVLRSFYAKDIHRITAYNNICYFLHKSGDNAEAELWANIALSQYPNQPILWGNLCVALKAQGKSAELAEAKMKRNLLKRTTTVSFGDLRKILSHPKISKSKFENR